MMPNLATIQRIFLLVGLLWISLPSLPKAERTDKLYCPSLGSPVSPGLLSDDDFPPLLLNATKCRHKDFRTGYACPVTRCKAHCARRHLDEITQNLPDWILELDLRHNNIRVIENRSLSKYTQLERLDLSNNNISGLYSESFFGLGNLKFLNLRFNSLSYRNETFPPSVFQPLTSLKDLKISKNNQNASLEGLYYPDNEFSALKSLESLYLDGLTFPKFGPGFKALTSLNILSVSGYIHGYCDLYGLERDTFVNLSQVKCLYLISCFIQGPHIHQETFLPLKNLIYLDLTHNEEIGFENLPKVSYGLTNTSSLRTLTLHLIVPRYSLGVCLKSESLQYFPQSVTKLYAGENNIQAVSKEAAELLPKGLQVLDLSGNGLVFGRSLQTLHKMTSLQTLKLNARSIVYQLPRNYPYQFSPDMSNHSSTNSTENCLDYYDKNATLVVQLPPHLRKIEMERAGLQYQLTKLVVDENNSLKALLLNGNRFPTLQGPMYGLHYLASLDLSDCYIEEMRRDFFKYLTTLSNLYLQWNELGNFFKSPMSDKIFDGVYHLHTLDLSYNNIEFLRRQVFYGLNELQRLRLDGNLITRFESDISHMSHLLYFNLSRTHLARLPSDTRHSVDALIQSGIKVKVNMRTAPISCDCENLDFLQWMTSSKAFDKTFEGYRCDYHNLKVQEVTDGYVSALIRLNRICKPHVYLLLVVSIAVTLLLVVLGVSICYRYRWNLRYLYHVAYLHYKKEKRPSPRDFEFDAFICYANEDEDFVVDVLEQELRRRGLKMYVHGRDFVAGEYISSNIVGAVCRCRKTLVVLTPSMVKSSWCNYEIQMANMESVHTGRKVLVFLLKGEIPTRRNSLNIFYNIQINTYLEYPTVGETTDDQMQALWDKLVRDIRS